MLFIPIGRNRVIRIIYIAIVLLAISVLYSSCVISKQHARAYRKLSQAERNKADTLLLNALDHEALYTLLDTLKPISSVKLLRLPLLSKQKQRVDSANMALESWARIAKNMQFPDLRFILQPFERNEGEDKYVEIYAVRPSVLEKKIQEQAAFYRRIGLAQAATAETVLAVTEYETKYNRWRSYGYLFGYPSYAIDFFVEAGKQQDSTGKFVPRDFFAIPVQAGNTGYFTYAIPKGHNTGQTDSVILQKATQTLNNYLTQREKVKKESLVRFIYKSNKKINRGKE